MLWVPAADWSRSSCWKLLAFSKPNQKLSWLSCSAHGRIVARATPLFSSQTSLDLPALNMSRAMLRGLVNISTFFNLFPKNMTRTLWGGLPEGQDGHLTEASDLTHQQDCGRYATTVKTRPWITTFKEDSVEKDKRSLTNSTARDRILDNVIVSGEKLHYK